MTTPWMAACLTVLLAPAPSRPEPPDPKALVTLATRIGIPMPPKDARLVLVYGWRDHAPGKPPTDTDSVFYTPAFLLEEKADGSIVILRGLDREIVKPAKKGELVWRKFSLDPVNPKTDGYGVGFGLDSFFCSVQVATRGDVAIARGIMKRFAEGVWFEDENLPEYYRDPQLLLGETFFERQYDRIPEGSANWRDVHTRMKAIFTELPALKNEGRQKLLDDLATSLAAKAPAAGSTEALVLEWAKHPPAERFGFSLFSDYRPDGPNAPALAVVVRGFDAIPDLIALLDDQRITTHQSVPFNRILPQLLRVGDLASELLQQVTGVRLTTADNETEAEAWRKWWGKVRVKPERDYYLGTIFEISDGKIAGINPAAACIIAHKFPAVLSSLCTEFSNRATTDAWPFELAQAVAGSGLPKGQRVKLLAAFAQRGTLSHRRGVLLALADLDGADCAKILIPLLEKFPKDTVGRYWASPEAGMSYVVVKLEDDAVWRAYLRAAKGSSVGLRMEMMDHFAAGAKNRERRLAFLAAFLDDETARDATSDPKRFAEPFAASEFPRLAVRDFVAMRIANVLGLEDTPEKSWDAEKWAGLRRKVRGKLSGERLPDLSPIP